jgi:hypothetical protein
MAKLIVESELRSRTADVLFSACVAILTSIMAAYCDQTAGLPAAAAPAAVEILLNTEKFTVKRLPPPFIKVCVPVDIRLDPTRSTFAVAG